MAESYKMDHPRRGKAIIISNENFTYLKKPPGSDHNVRYITDGLKACGFDVHTYRDLTRLQSKDETKYTIMNLAKEVAGEDHSDADCMVFCILSHGSEDGICGIDYKDKRDSIKIQDIVEPFKGGNCQRLAGKPKIFIINACRGGKMDDGAVNQMSVSMSPFPKGSTIQNQPQRIPTSADILIFTSSYPDYESYTTEDGSHFMKSLGDHLYKLGQVKPLREIFDMVKNDVASHENNREDQQECGVKEKDQIVFQMPQVEETLRKQIYFGTTPSKKLKSGKNVDNRLQSGYSMDVKPCLEPDKRKIPIVDVRRITYHFVKLVKTLDRDIKPLMDELYSKFVITEDEREKIEQMIKHDEKGDGMRRLLNIIINGGDDAYKEFTDSLETMRYMELLENLRRDIYEDDMKENTPRIKQVMVEMMKEEGGNKITKAEMTGPTCQRGNMKKEDYKKFKKCMTYIQANIKDDVSRLARDLMSEHVIDVNDMTILDNIQNASTKADRLLHILLGRGHQAYQGFLSCLRQSGFGHLADVINGDQEPQPISSRPRGWMAEEDLKKIRANHDALKDQMDAELVSGKLFEAGVFDTNDRELIINTPTAQQNTFLLSLLIDCGPEAYGKFLSCLGELEYAELKKNLEYGTSSIDDSQRRRGSIADSQRRQGSIAESSSWFSKKTINPVEVARTLYIQSVFNHADLTKVEDASLEDTVGVLLGIVQLQCPTGAYDNLKSVLRGCDKSVGK